MAESAVARMSSRTTAANQKPVFRKLSWTAMLWADLLAVVSGLNELNDPLLGRW